MTEKEVCGCFPFLTQMPQSEKRYFLDSAVEKRLRAGETAMSDYAEPSDVYFVLSGELEVLRIAENGREFSLYTVEAGEAAVLSALHVFSGIKEPTAVSLAAVRTSRAAVLPRRAFGYLFSTSPVLQRFVNACLCRKLDELIGRMELLTLGRVGDRIDASLKQGTQGGRHAFYITHAQLAARLGTSREVVTRRLGRLRKEGRIRTERGKITWLKKTEDKEE